MLRLLILVSATALAFGSMGTAAAGAVDTDLMAAIRAANADGVRAALSRGADVSDTRSRWDDAAALGGAS